MYDLLPLEISADVVVGLDDVKSIDGDVDDGADVEDEDEDDEDEVSGCHVPTVT